MLRCSVMVFIWRDAEMFSYGVFSQRDAEMFSYGVLSQRDAEMFSYGVFSQRDAEMFSYVLATEFSSLSIRKEYKQRVKDEDLKKRRRSDEKEMDLTDDLTMEMRI
ncbi:hypothetical protein QVD17_06406 [Tagetes erecta]|uniref:Uncharacterized protein n=1 Tax=Tagetes erecta TaxID=13708 RepID=A0AAD8LLM3_TARER|nr:hypothetical protein QVD17_06406 [Tagetes erecta]